MVYDNLVLYAGSVRNRSEQRGSWVSDRPRHCRDDGLPEIERRGKLHRKMQHW